MQSVVALEDTCFYFFKTERINEPYRTVLNKAVCVLISTLLQGIPIYPSLHVGIVETISVIIHGTVCHELFTGETVRICSRECPTARNRITERIVSIAGR